MQHRVIVVGGGIVGTLHAWYAIRSGWAVTHIEADAEPRMGSVRGNGLLTRGTPGSGDESRHVAESIALWREISDQVPRLVIQPMRSARVALNQVQAFDLVNHLDLSSFGDDGLWFRRGDGVIEICPWASEHIVAALCSTNDALIEPGAALVAVRAELALHASYRFVPGVRAIDVGSGGLMDQYGERYFADHIILATGAEQTLFAADPSVRRSLAISTALMVQTRPMPERLEMAVLGVLDTDVSIVPQRDGSVIVGAVIDTVGTHLFAVEDAQCRSLVTAASKLIGRNLTPITRRWLTRFTTCADGRLGFVYEPTPGVTVVTGLGINGLATAPTLARSVIASLGSSQYSLDESLDEVAGDADDDLTAELDAGPELVPETDDVLV